MQRFNAFLLIHKGLRALLYDVSLSIQHTDFANATEFPHSLERLEHTVDLFDAHAGHEDKHLFCLLESCNPQLQEEMEEEHVTDHALSAELKALIAAYRNATEAAGKGALGNKIHYTFNDFIAFNLTHLNKEETIVNESLWKHYSDMDIMQANARLIGSLHPEEVKKNAIWMMRGCNNTEIIDWMGMVKKTAPAPVLQLLLSIAEKELPTHRFEAVQSRVMELA
jgi:hypothetical protein